MQRLERKFAFEWAAGLIDTNTLRCYDEEDEPLRDWCDLATADDDLSEEVTYLEARGLLERHPGYGEWVRILRPEDSQNEGQG